MFLSNCGSGHLTEYGYRWKIESGYRSIKRFVAATTSKDFGLRFFYFAFACLLNKTGRLESNLTTFHSLNPMLRITGPLNPLWPQLP